MASVRRSSRVAAAAAAAAADKDDSNSKGARRVLDKGKTKSARAQARTVETKLNKPQVKAMVAELAANVVAPGATDTPVVLIEASLEAAGISVAVNADKPRRGTFEVRAHGTVVLSLVGMKRPFPPLKALDMDKVVADVMQASQGAAASS